MSNKTKVPIQQTNHATKRCTADQPRMNCLEKGLDAAQEASLYKLTERWQNYRDVQNEPLPQQFALYERKEPA